MTEKNKDRLKTVAVAAATGIAAYMIGKITGIITGYCAGYDYEINQVGNDLIEAVTSN